MALFQKSILAKYLTPIKGTLHETYEAYTLYFLNDEIQENILQSKEEQFQEGFLRELFVKFLGYTINPEPNYNLTTEYKNSTDSRKADGAILLEGNPIGIIELKDHKTQDLRDVETQAFSYKSKHRGVRYVIISNFEKLRFYIDDAVDCEEFDLFNLTETEFEKLYLLLSYESIKKDIPLEIKNNSCREEKDITDALYKDYSSFKRELFADICNRNAEKADKLTLFRKTQKLLDRLLFIFFAEDRGLIPPNIITKVVEDVKQLRDLDEAVSLYDRFKKYFGYLDKGHKNKDFEIFAYNGGLFRADDLLDSLEIDDTLLEKHTLKLSAYDFESNVSVDILGHIFEHSLTEIEEIEQNITNPNTQKSTKKKNSNNSKRKKDGVFYTPPFITHYIVENTLGVLCKQKKDELKILDSRASKKKQQELLDEYQKWLLTLKICDPACGSGAFLNAALEFLIEEHLFIDKQKALLRENKKNAKIQMALSDIDAEILENNIYGVDINEESVEIAKLSLWLHTARPGRKLTDLSKNIKCGNSLINDISIAKEKAFNWETEFPDVFANKGFDIIVGNPPYVRADILPPQDQKIYKEHYKVFAPDADLFFYFYEKGMNLVKPQGLFGFISNTFDKTSTGKILRKYIAEETKIEKYIDFTGVQIFKGATTYPVILILSKQLEKNSSFEYRRIIPEKKKILQISDSQAIQVQQNSLDPNSWGFASAELSSILNRMKRFRPISEQFGKCFYGVKTALNNAYFIDEHKKSSIVSEDASSTQIIKNIFEGEDLNKWISLPISKYVLEVHNGYGDTPAININDYPAVKKHLDEFLPDLENRSDKGITPYNLRNCAYQKLFYGPKIIWGNLQLSNKFSYDDNGVIISAPCCMLPTDNKALLAILNSKIIWLFLTNICTVRNGGYIEVKPQYFETIPIPELTFNLNNMLFAAPTATVKALSSLADEVLALCTNLQKKRSQFIHRLTESFNSIKITAILKNFDSSDFKTIFAELKKQKIKLSLNDQDEWEEYFNSHKKDCNDIAVQIAELEHKIDNEVYALYGLTPEEIAVIERN